jgi:hypothetical protein
MSTTAGAQSRIQIVVSQPSDMQSQRQSLPSGGSTLPMFCPMCHGAVTLQFIGKWLEENLIQQWACPHCRQMNKDGFPYRVAWVTRDHG